MAKYLLHGMSRNPLYKIWLQMKQRCLNPRNAAYSYYGGRGIMVCERWLKSFPAFAQDMGDRPEGFTLERINNDGPYSTENCKWASRREQSLNWRNTRKITIDGVEYKAALLSELSGLKTDTIMERAKSCHTLKELLDPEPQYVTVAPRRKPTEQYKAICKHGHALDEGNTYWSPDGYRQCRICRTAQDHKRRRK